VSRLGEVEVPLIFQYVRPPNLKLNSINIGSSGVTLASNGFSLSLTLGIR
jgi:hypothetical protein